MTVEKRIRIQSVTTKTNLDPGLLMYGNISLTEATWIMRNFCQEIVTVEAKRSAMILIWNIILRMQKNAKRRSETEEKIGRTTPIDLKLMAGVQNEKQLYKLQTRKQTPSTTPSTTPTDVKVKRG